MPDQVDPLPLSASQMQIWLGQKKRPDSPLYNMAYAYRIYGKVKPQEFDRAWAQLTQSTASLKTRIVEQKDSVAQTFNGKVKPLLFFDLSTHDQPELETDIWMQQQICTTFDLTGSLVTCALLKLSDSDWVWFCNQHHLITDAWSSQLLWENLAYHYFLQDTPELPVDGTSAYQYTDYLAHERQQRDSLSEESLKHWESRQNNGPLTLYGRENPGDITLAHRFDHLFTDTQSVSMKKLCTLEAAKSFSHQLTQVHILLAIYAIYLHRVSGNDTITLYAPLLNRTNQDLRTTTGLVTEVVPLTLELSAEHSFETVVGIVRQEMTHCLKHAYTGVASQVKQQHCTGVFNYISNATSNFGDWPATARWLHSGHNDSHHVIRLHFTQYHQDDSPSLLFEFNGGSFSKDQCNTALHHWWSVFNAVTSDPHSAIGLINLCRSEFSTPLTDHRVTPELTIVDLVDSTIAANPNAIAVADQQSEITYEDFRTLVNTIAGGLSSSGVQSGDRVLVIARRCTHLPAVFLAILNIGAVYVPVDPLTPPARIEKIIQQCDPTLLIASNNTIGKLPKNHNSILIETLASNVAENTQTSVHRYQPPKATQLAYIMFTSGSTGEPKGVMINHAALVNYIQWAAGFYTDNLPLTFPLYTSIGFDLTVTSLYVPLVTGGRVLVYPEIDAPVDLVLLDVVNDNQSDIIKLTPAHLALLKGQDLSASKIKQLIVGGEDLKTQLAASFSKEILIHNEYGPTEATVGCIVHTFNSTNDKHSSVPIGTPRAGTVVRIVNAYGIDQPAGIAGELLLSGPSLAQGYWKNAEETAKRFISDSDTTKVSYKTGDIVRQLEDGNLAYIGRADSQIKLNGHRIELTEIESLCLQIPGVTACTSILTKPVDSRITNHVNQPDLYCVRCGLSSQYPLASYDDNSVCHLCQRFEKYQSRANQYFRPTEELLKIVEKIKAQQAPQYDCIVLASGGKDSSYMLGRLVDMGLRVLAFTLDNGFISDGAKENVQRICAALKVDHVYGKTDAMNDIFKDSLERHSNVCHGCFKTIYTLSLKEANDRGIGTIFTGLSRGQFFETRLTEELFTNADFKVSEIDVVVLNARKSYHQIDDAVKNSLDTTHIRNGKLLDQIQFVDFYRYCDVNLDELFEYLNTRLPWVRPTDTGRSTNCLINDVGIYVHKAERGYHNYALPYSWDVRLGHKERDAALDELDDQIDEAQVKKILDQINYQVKPSGANRPASIAVYFTSENNLSADNVRTALKTTLPPAFQPTYVIPIEKLPLNKNGKIDKTALPAPHTIDESPQQSVSLPKTAIESELAEHWHHILNRSPIDVTANFFALGGDSLMAIKLISAINRSDFSYSITDLFENPTISEMALLNRKSTQRKLPPEQSTPFSQLDNSQLAKLADKLPKRK